MAGAKSKLLTDNLGDANEVIPFYELAYFGADFTVEGLVRRLQSQDIYLPAWQRSYVWDFQQACRFIESLLLGLPVPGIFLARDDDARLLVVDGHQRLRTLEYFYQGLGVFKGVERKFVLKNVYQPYRNATYDSLDIRDKRRLDDTLIHATVVRQEELSQDNSGVYLLFERLNTGGEPLLPQEIRRCIYHGKFSELLRRLNEIPAWRQIYGHRDERMRDQELILRFLALNFDGESYRKPMKSFLNLYMGKNRHLADTSATQHEHVFMDAINTIAQVFGERAFRPKNKMNVAVFDAVMVGIARRMNRNQITDYTGLQERYLRLIGEPQFIHATERSTADERNVELRLTLATNTFADLI